MENTPIISPWLIYIVNALPSITLAFEIIAGWCLFIVVCIFIYLSLIPNKQQELLVKMSEKREVIERLIKLDKEHVFSDEQLEGYKAEYEKNIQEEKKLKKKFKIYLLYSLFAFLTSLFLPTKETGFQMLIASQITPNNIEYLHNTFKDDYKFTIDTLIGSIADAIVKIDKGGNK